jgi:KUP system potassium uptake protein
MLLWFFAIGAIGLRWIIAQPVVLEAINPLHGVEFLIEHGAMGFLLIGLVFLVVTGGEALYADMGHFGRKPIRIAWFAVALPGLLLNYFGQGAVLLSHPTGTIQNPFYAAAEGPLLIPMLVLAMMAAIIASQALISGVFSITRQAMQLGLFPRVTVVHTSAKMEGQIYIPEMNWLLMAGTIAVVLQFRSSSGLAAAYGIAVTGTMGITSFLFYLVCRRRWGYSQAKASRSSYRSHDRPVLPAIRQILDGGWFRSRSAIVFVVMTTWWLVASNIRGSWTRASCPTAVPTDIAAAPPHRVRGTAVFISSTPGGTRTFSYTT